MPWFDDYATVFEFLARHDIIAPTSSPAVVSKSASDSPLARRPEANYEAVCWPKRRNAIKILAWSLAGAAIPKPLHAVIREAPRNNGCIVCTTSGVGVEQRGAE